jgi:N utilization substance protein B
MTRRFRAREVALQLLFQFDLNPKLARPVLEQFTRDRLREPDLARFCLELFDNVKTNRDAIDQRLIEAAENWRLPRMTCVDRNVLRLGAGELLFGGVPATAAINEAIELARRFGSEDSPGFVNGVLDRIANPPVAAPAAPPAEAEATTPEPTTPNPESTTTAAATSEPTAPNPEST